MGLAATQQKFAVDIPAHIPDDIRGFVRAFGVPRTLKDYAEIVSRQRMDLNCMTAAQKYTLKNHIVIFKSIRSGSSPPPDAWKAFVAAAPHEVAADQPLRLAPQSAIGAAETVAQTLQHQQVSEERASSSSSSCRALSAESLLWSPSPAYDRRVRKHRLVMSGGSVTLLLSVLYALRLQR